MTNEFNISMKMSDLLGEHSSLLAVFSRMGFRFGYGDASVGDVCAGAGVDPHSFLLICKVYSQDNYIPSREDIERADRTVIANYLRASHVYYEDVALKELASGLSRMILPCTDETQHVIWKFFSDFKEEVHEHFKYEENVVFPNIGDNDACIQQEDHSGVEETLEDLKNLVMNYLPDKADQREAFNVLSSLSSLQADIHKHIFLEETALEGRKMTAPVDRILSDREKEVLVCVAKGMINKEIAAPLVPWRLICGPVLFFSGVVLCPGGVLWWRAPVSFCGLPQHTDIPSVPQEGRGHAPGALKTHRVPQEGVFGTEYLSRTVEAYFEHRVPLKTRRVPQEPFYGTARRFCTGEAPFRYRISQTDTRCIVWWLLRRAIR